MYGNLSETLTKEPQPQLSGAGKPPVDPPRTAVGTGGPPPEDKEPHPESIPPRRRQPVIRNLPDMGVEVKVSTETGMATISVFEIDGVVQIEARGGHQVPVTFTRVGTEGQHLGSFGGGEDAR